uniref:right-handed parallel beta-helix repeat-containing protein n=1 Tax=uncultured Draconibacterium sp. TaxID=1573823 RepID=UPI003216E3F3
MKLKTLLLPFFCLLATVAFSQKLTLHVSTQGDDRNPGTEELPVASISRAAELINKTSFDSAHVLIHEGVYHLKQGIVVNGQQKIIYSGVDKNKVIVKGSTGLKSFKKLSKHHALYKKNPETGKKIIEFDLSNIEGLTHEKLRLAGASSVPELKDFRLHELIVDGKTMPLSRWPNGDNYAEFTDSIVDSSNKRVGIRYTDDEISSWENEPNILLHGYWKYLWADAYEQVDYIDKERKIIWLNPPCNHYGFEEKKPFAAINVISEIDQPGEWAYDYKAQKIFFYPKGDVKNSEIELSICKEPLFRIENAQHITVKNITFCNGAGPGIEVENSSNINIKNCVVKVFPRDGISVQQGQNNTISDCEVFDTGRGAIVVNSGSYSLLEKVNFRIENCHLHHLSRIDKTYTPGIQVDGVGTTIRNCEMHDIPSSAIRLNGNDHLVEYNKMYDVVTESDDQGAIDMWGTQNYRGNVIRYNYFYDVGPKGEDAINSHCGKAGVRLDDAISGVFIYGNIFRNTSVGLFGAVQIHGGKDNIVWNNIIYNCETGVSFSPWKLEKWEDYTREAKEFFTANRLAYITKYPQIIEYDENLNRNTVIGNVLINCKKSKVRDKEGVNTWKNNLEIKYEGENLEQTNYSLEVFSNQLEAIQFIPVPFSEIGLKKKE